MTTPVTIDPLITDSELRRIAGGVTSMTIWRWRKAGLLPPPIVIRCRNFNRQSAVNEALARLIGDHPQAQ